MAEAGGVGNHDGVVGAEIERRGGEGGAVLEAGLLEHGADELVGGDTASGNDLFCLGLLDGLGGFMNKNFGGGVLEAGGDVGKVGLRVFGQIFADGSFEAGK